MITFFTTTKKFQGHAKDSQLNAIRSWLELHPDVEIFIFEKPVGSECIPPDARIKIIEEVESQFNIPRIDFMFDYASRNAKNKMCCFINADIIVTEKFLEAAQRVYKSKPRFLAVGQRFDFDNLNGEWEMTNGWEQRYIPKESEMKLHAPAGSDYFLFPAKQYKKSEMVPLIVGRPAWDLWMIYDGRKKKIPVIDLSLVYKVFHQNHDYSHKKVIYKNNLDEPEAKVNLLYLPEGGKYDFTLDACDYMLDKNLTLKRSYARGDFHKYMKIEGLLKKNRFIAAIKYRALTEEEFK